MADLLNLGMFGKKPLKDQVTPYKMALFVLVSDYCVQIHERSQVLSDDENTYTEKEEREILFTILQFLQSADMELKGLIKKLQPVAKPKLMDMLLTELRALSVDGIRSVMDLFQGVPTALFVEKSPLLHKSSVFGLFVRRMVLSFEKLSFSQVTKLHQKYKAFYEAWASKNPASSTERQTTANAMSDNMMDSLEGCGFNDTAMSMMEFTGEDGVQDDGNMHSLSGGDAGRYSQRQAEYFIAQQATLLHHNESEALSPKQLQQKINELLASNPELAEGHYLSYMNSLRVNEYCSAVDSLYHFFDRHPSICNGSQSKSKPEDEVAYRGLRYAALNMAALHFRFGHREEALAAVQEAVRIAQEANDHVCLQHALSWLQRLGVDGTRNAVFFLDRLVTKSGELNLPYLTSLGVKAFTHHTALTGAQPSGVFEYLLKSDIVNCQHSQSDLMCVGYGQKASLWNLYGHSEMCSLSCQLMLHLNTINLDVYHNEEPECLALCYLARQQANQGDFNLAFVLLDHAKVIFPQHSKRSHAWMLQEQLLIFTRAMYHCKWSGAEQAISNMEAVDNQEAKYCRALLYKEKGETDMAFSLIESLIQECTGDEDKRPLPEYYARVLMLKAELYYGTGNPTEAGQPLLVCLTIARHHHLTYIVAIATLHFAYVQMLLGMTHQALSLLSSAFIDVLRHGNLYDRSRAHYLLVRCMVITAKDLPKPERIVALKPAVALLNDIIMWFRKTEAYHRAKDAVYYQARLYHELGYIAERNKCALDFRTLDNQYPTWTSCSVLKL